MTTLAPGTDSATTQRTDHRSWFLLVVAAVAVVATVGLTLIFGIERPPTLERLIDITDPAPTVSIAWSAWEGDESCIHVARPDGSVQTPYCDPGGSEVVGWTDDGELLVQAWDTPGRMRVVDPATGEITGRVSGDPADLRPHGGEAVWTEREGDELVVGSRDDDTELWRVAAPRRYDVTASARSADGRWIAVVDTAGRLLVVPADASEPPRVWVDDVVEWTLPVWEGGAGPQ